MKSSNVYQDDVVVFSKQRTGSPVVTTKLAVSVKNYDGL